LESATKKIIKTVKIIADKAGIAHPDLAVEWGRYLVAPAQINVYRIIAEKEIVRQNGNDNKSGARIWSFIDGSFQTQLLDTWAIHQKWHVTPANNMLANKFKKVWLSGCSCDSDDKYTNGGSYILIPKIESAEKEGINDPQYVVIYDTGAYQDALANHHCLISSPAKIIVQNGVITIARERETAEEVGQLYGW
ncbi:MAG TPA: hypothetical protein P5267_03670, partial [Patescibacteria group bacterium]|nr:hypothetical protein [Patescibacteria group bacterium]